jgi:hypothetical protein
MADAEAEPRAATDLAVLPPPIFVGGPLALDVGARMGRSAPGPLTIFVGVRDRSRFLSVTGRDLSS